MTVVNAWQGAATSTSFRVRAKVTGSSTRLLVSTHPDISEPIEFGPVLPSNDIATLDAAGLSPGNRYWWAVEEDGVVDTQFTGTIQTFPIAGLPATFTFAAATCAGADPDEPGVGDVLAPSRLSNHQVFDTIRSRGVAEGWLFFAHIGDMHYYDLGSDNHGIVGGGSLENYLRCYDDVLEQPNQHALYRELPLVYSAGAGGHDYGQPIHLARTLPGRDNQIQAWRERVPDYPTANSATTAGTYRSFIVGRVLFIVTDENADRDPDGDPEGPNKTKLGNAQKAWLEQTLTNTEAEALVWLSGAQWERGGSANWGRYTTERDELASMFTDLGWADRMVMVTGDRHALEIVQRLDNQWGGFPIWHFASLDCPPSETPGPGAVGLPGNNQYGTVEVLDTGTEITLTGTGWIGSMFWDSDFLTISTPVQVPEEPTESLDILPVGVSSPIVSWASFDLISGDLIADLPDVTGDVGRLLGAYTTSALSLPIPLAGNSALRNIAIQATVPGRTMLVAIINDEPAWGGRIVARAGGTDGKLELAASTLEAYLTRRRVLNHNLSDTDEAVIMETLFKDAGSREISGIGLVGGIGLEIDSPEVGISAEGIYSALDRTTVYSAVRERAARESGLEWTIEILWANEEHTRIRKVVRVAPRIGTPSSTPKAVFETSADSVFDSRSGNEASYSYDEDYSDGRGATWVEVYSTGEGEDQPTSDPAIALDKLVNGWPIDEHHLATEATVLDEDVLNSHARQELELRRNGSITWNITSRWNIYPQLNIDWRLGDDVAWKLIGHRHPAPGITGQGRCIGWELRTEEGTINPILLDPLSGGDVG